MAPIHPSTCSPSAASGCRAAPPARLLHRLSGLVALFGASADESSAQAGGGDVAVGPDGYSLCMHGRHMGLEATELLLPPRMRGTTIKH